MNGYGIIKGLGVTLKHFIDTYIQDIRWHGKLYRTKKGIDFRTGGDANGVFTIQYPEESLPTPEEFRFLPILIYDEGPNGEKDMRCTCCGICAKVCPPQCIWITRAADPVTGRPMPAAAEFSIDTDICMNCGFCVEYCAFDAIKMDHNYEIATYSRENGHIYDIEQLAKPMSYYAKIRPVNYQREETARKEKEAAKAASKKAATEAAAAGKDV
jgi:NADH-quinone oxidoreductase subunit I